MQISIVSRGRRRDHLRNSFSPIAPPTRPIMISSSIALFRREVERPQCRRIRNGGSGRNVGASRLNLGKVRSLGLAGYEPRSVSAVLRLANAGGPENGFGSICGKLDQSGPRFGSSASRPATRGAVWRDRCSAKSREGRERRAVRMHGSQLKPTTLAPPRCMKALPSQSHACSTTGTCEIWTGIGRSQGVASCLQPVGSGAP
jgi:hypothetical protein